MLQSIIVFPSSELGSAGLFVHLEVLAAVHQQSQCNIPKNFNIFHRCCKILKYRKKVNIFKISQKEEMDIFVLPQTYISKLLLQF